MKNYSLVGLLLLLVGALFAQSDTPPTNEQRGLSIELGGAYTARQDLRFSTLQFTGIGGTLGIGLRRSTDEVQRWGGLRVAATPTSAAGGEATTLRLHAMLAYEYARKALAVAGGHLLLGGDLRAGGEALLSGAEGNNSIGVYSTVSVGPRAAYVRPLAGGRFIASLAVGLLHFDEDMTSFAFSAPQDYLEAGEFTYQPEGAPAYAPFVYNDFHVLGQVNDLRTRLRYERDARWAVQYDWRYRAYRVVEGYPTRSALHRLAVSYTF